MKHTTFSTRITLALIACCLMAAAGCGGGVERQSLSGKVTYQGQPVPVGRIIFEPDASKGNDGPQGVASIKDGYYSTDKFGRGAVSGPLIVRIVGFNKAGGEGDGGQDGVAAKPLFSTYTTRIELGKENSSFDFEIPATGTQGR